MIPGEDENATGNTVLDEVYSAVNTYWIEQVTGQIVAAEFTESSTFDLFGETRLVKAKYSGTTGDPERADGIAALANEVKSQAEKMKILGWTFALVLGFLGVVLVLAGLLLLLWRGSKQDAGAT